MEVDQIGKKSNGNGKGKAKAKSQAKTKGKSEIKDNGKGNGKSKGKRAKAYQQDKECFVCGKKGHFERDCRSRAKQYRTVNEVEDAKVDSDAAKEFAFTIESLSQTWLRSPRRRFGDN